MNSHQIVIKILLSTFVMAACFANAEGATRGSVCGSPHAQQVAARMKQVKSNVRSQIDTTVSLDKSPYVYKNPDAGCDLGLSMPGLPNFGFGLEGIDSCKILKMVTGDLVKSVNKGMRDTVDKAVDSASGGKGDFNYDIDLGKIAQDEIRN
jgi:hypothetical protein